MTRFKTLDELKHFEDTSSICLCKRLMTGLHMQTCRLLRKQHQRFEVRK